MIKRIAGTEVLVQCRHTLSLYDDSDVADNNALLAALIRRSAGIHSPCSRSTLRTSLIECMHGLPILTDSLNEAIDAAIEALIICGGPARTRRCLSR